MTLHDHLVFASRCVGADPGEALGRAEALGLEYWFGTSARMLSTGNARKLWYLVCSAGEFDTVLLDEPFNGLDGESADTIVAEIRHWSETKTVMLVAHSLPDGLFPDMDLHVAPSGRSRVSRGTGTQDTARSSG
jgi:ABC-type multidrug transport system ATPase subunit